MQDTPAERDGADSRASAPPPGPREPGYCVLLAGRKRPRDPVTLVVACAGTPASTRSSPAGPLAEAILGLPVDIVPIQTAAPSRTRHVQAEGTAARAAIAPHHAHAAIEAILERGTVARLHDLRSFRHLVHHGYGADFDPVRLHTLRDATLALRPATVALRPKHVVPHCKARERPGRRRAPSFLEPKEAPVSQLSLLLPLAVGGCASQSARDPGEWNKVENQSAARVEIVEDSAQPATADGANTEVTCVAASATVIETTVEGDTLYIRAADELAAAGCVVTVPADMVHELYVKGSGSVESTATFPHLEVVEVTGTGNVDLGAALNATLDVRVRGSGNVTLRWIEAEEANFDLAGQGSVTAAGTVETGTLSVSGTGAFYGAELEFETLYVDIAGTGDAYINVTGHAVVSRHGSGLVVVTGSGEVEFTD